MVALGLTPLVIGHVLTGCSEDACERANDLIGDCASPDVTVPSLSQASMSLSCSGSLLCQAQCINQASCLEIAGLQCFDQISCENLSPTSAAYPLATCILGCSGMSIDGGSDSGAQ